MTHAGNSDSQPTSDAGRDRPRQVYYVRLDPPQTLTGDHLPPSSYPDPQAERIDGRAGAEELRRPVGEGAREDSQASVDSPENRPLTAESPTYRPTVAASHSNAASPHEAPSHAAESADERLRQQARQLAAHLRARRQAVNRRRQEIDDQFSRDRAETTRRVALIQEREEQLDRHQEFVDQLKAEATATHQEALETRLATEQLWAKMADRADLPTILERIADLKRRLADQHRNTLHVIARQQEALQRAAEQLDRRQAELRRQRDELQAWVLRRHEELEQQRLQLIAREQELEAQERARQEIHSRVEEEILGYQRQIRQLTAQLRCKQELGRLRDTA